MIRRAARRRPGLLRTGFRMILDAQPDIEVVGEAADGADAVRQRGRGPAARRGADGRPHARHGRHRGHRGDHRAPAPAARVLILTTSTSTSTCTPALRAGASGFLLKDAPPAELLAAIRAVAAGDAVVAPPRHPAAARPVRARCCPPAPAAATRTPLLAGSPTASARCSAESPAGQSNARDRRAAVPVGGHGQDPRRPDAGQARPPRPGPGRGRSPTSPA